MINTYLEKNKDFFPHYNIKTTISIKIFLDNNSYYLYNSCCGLEPLTGLNTAIKKAEIWGPGVSPGYFSAFILAVFHPLSYRHSL